SDVLAAPNALTEILCGGSRFCWSCRSGKYGKFCHDPAASQETAMTPLGQVMHVAAAGVVRAQDSFEKAATELPKALVVDSVSLTGEARADLPQAMVDMRVAKYAFVANLRVLQAADETTQELLNAVKR
ncbi:MAG TPA: hypothetical protein PKD61_11455, partial [Polyangiaceae bacterium]|nr:hypothetical protein [Polyangiaceae bacterium]